MVSADGPGDPANIDEVFQKIQPDIVEMIKPISAVLVFISIIALGINIIIKSRKPDERSGFMAALIGVAAGVFILGSAGLIYSFIMSLMIE